MHSLSRGRCSGLYIQLELYKGRELVQCCFRFTPKHYLLPNQLNNNIQTQAACFQVFISKSILFIFVSQYPYRIIKEEIHMSAQSELNLRQIILWISLRIPERYTQKRIVCIFLLMIGINIWNSIKVGKPFKCSNGLNIYCHISTKQRYGNRKKRKQIQQQIDRYC